MVVTVTSQALSKGRTLGHSSEARGTLLATCSLVTVGTITLLHMDCSAELGILADGSLKANISNANGFLVSVESRLDDDVVQVL